jgi:hypothetical protein
MLTLRMSVPALGRAEDKRLYELAYALPAPVSDSSSSASSNESATTHSSIDSQRIINLAKLNSRKQATQKYSSTNTTKPCLVCWSKDCKLKSHHDYVSQQKSRASNGPRKTSPRKAQIKLSLPIGNGMLDPFTALPMEGPSRESLQLFHDFFTNQASQVHVTPKRLAFDSTYSPLLLQQAYADSATCHSCLAMACTYAAVHGRDLRAPDESLSRVYEAALRALRAQLIREKAKPRTTTVMAAVNLIMAQAIGMCDKEALDAHRTGNESFVRAWGGIHNLEPQLVSLIVWTDYWATLFTGLPPLYTHLLSRIEIKLERPPAQKYGHAFEEPRMRGLVSPMLLDNCRITCRLVELVEDKVNKTSTLARWQFWTYKRDTMATRNAVVHSELFGAGTKAECISLTMNMMLLLTLRMVPWKSPANELCDQMKIALTASGAPHTFWKLDIDILLYILFIVLAAGIHWDDRSWALEILQQTLQAKYGPIQVDWPTNWEEQETFNLKRFAWSEVLLETAFKDTCHQLDLNRHHDLDNNYDYTDESSIGSL